MSEKWKRSSRCGNRVGNKFYCGRKLIDFIDGNVRFFILCSDLLHFARSIVVLELKSFRVPWTYYQFHQSQLLFLWCIIRPNGLEEREKFPPFPGKNPSGRIFKCNCLLFSNFSILTALQRCKTAQKLTNLKANFIILLICLPKTLAWLSFIFNSFVFFFYHFHAPLLSERFARSSSRFQFRTFRLCAGEIRRRREKEKIL